MSEKERLKLWEKLEYGLRKSYEDMLNRKSMLGESIVTVDSNGHPIEITAKEALERLHSSERKADI